MKIVVTAGARPNFMKIAPLVKAVRSYNKENKRRIKQVLIHTGQHYDDNMSEIFFRELGIPAPDVNLGVGSGSQAEQTAKIMLTFEPVCQKLNPDWVIVVGDVNSTLACSLVAAKLGIKVAHIEAGLRSFDRTMPEEINRLLTDALSDLLFTPSVDANLNLKKEGIPAKKIRLVGNIMIDTLICETKKAENSQLPARFNLKPKQFAYVTLHRPSNVDEPRTLRLIMKRLANISKHFSVIFPAHPRTRKMLQKISFKSELFPRFLLIDPVGYRDSLWLAKNALFVLTDSGGLQEETTYFKTPCLTLRPNTERPITIRIGTNRLTSIATLEEDIDRITQEKQKNGRIPKYWDGRTAERIVQYLVEYSLPESF